MEFNKIIRNRRLDLGLGIREAIRQTDRSFIPSPIVSPVYLSRLESGDSSEMPVSSASIDKLWALGAVLRMNPLELFLQSRGTPNLIPEINNFVVRDSLPMGFGQAVSLRRLSLGLSLRECCEAASPWSVSTGYWSQMETDFRTCSEKVSGEKLWGIGWALSMDPLLLYVLSRKMDNRYLSATSRDRIFR
jgi:transcriptional regulator with XRE-family HTH domain